MSEKVLLVDDETNVLEAYQRSLRKLRDQFRVETAESGEQALERLESEGPFAVIVSNMRMPGMNGVDLLAEFKTRSPDSVRMMLTGNSDQQTAIDAVNEGDIFRFLSKPCEPKDFARAIFAGLNHHRLITAEKELLEKTLHGSIQVLAEVLSLANPAAFGRTTRLQRHVRQVAGAMGLPDAWQLETAALLSQIGCVSLTEEVAAKAYQGAPLSPEETELYARHPEVGADLLAKIPRLEAIAEAVRYQGKNFDGSGTPADAVQGREIPLGARLLKPITDLDRLEASGLSSARALEEINRHARWYDAGVLSALGKVIGAEAALEMHALNVLHLEDGMILAEDITATSGVLVVAKGQQTTRSMRERLVTLRHNGVIPEQVRILVPPPRDDLDPLSGAQGANSTGRPVPSPGT